MEIEALVYVIDPDQERLARIGRLFEIADKDALVAACTALDAACNAETIDAQFRLPDDLERIQPQRWQLEPGYVEAQFTFGSDGDELVRSWVRLLLLASPGSAINAWGSHDEGPGEIWLKGGNGEVEQRTAEPLQSRTEDQALLEGVYTWWHADMPANLNVGTLAGRFKRFRSRPPSGKKATAKKKTIFMLYEERDLDALAQRLTARNLYSMDKQEFDLFERSLADGERAVSGLMIEKGYDVQRNDEEFGSNLFHRLNGQRFRHSSTPTNRAACVAYLAGLGLDINEFAAGDLGGGQTPLMAAVDAYRNVEVALALVAAGADVNLTDRRARTALLFVNESSTRALVSALADAGADVCHRDSSGSSALFAAASCNNLEVAEELVRRGAPVDRPNDKGMTPLRKTLSALRADDAEDNVALFLLRQGADPRIEYREGQRIIDHPQMRQLLESHGLLDRYGQAAARE